MTPLKAIDPVDALWVVGLFVWLSLSILFAIEGNGSTFQRLGALLVAIVGIYYAIVPHVPSLPPGAIQIDALATKQTKRTSDMTALLHDRLGFLANDIQDVLVKNGKAVPQTVSDLAETVTREGFKPLDMNEFETVIAEADRVAEQRLAAETFVARTNSIRMRTQAVMLSIGTLQWGFGDMLFEGVCLC